MPVDEKLSDVLWKAQNVCLDFAHSSPGHKKAKEEYEAYKKAFEGAIEVKGLWDLFIRYDSARDDITHMEEDAALERIFFLRHGLWGKPRAEGLLMSGYQYLPNLSLDEYEALRESIRENGVIEPVVVDESGVVIVSGK